MKCGDNQNGANDAACSCYSYQAAMWIHYIYIYSSRNFSWNYHWKKRWTNMIINRFIRCNVPDKTLNITMAMCYTITINIYRENCLKLRHHDMAVMGNSYIMAGPACFAKEEFHHRKGKSWHCENVLIIKKFFLNLNSTNPMNVCYRWIPFL